MDLLAAANDFEDWELLQTNSDPESAPVVSPDSGYSFDGIDSGGLIQANYFSLDSHDRYGERVYDGESIGSNNSDWVDPGVEEDTTRRPNEEPGEVWPDSSSERSEDRKFSELVGVNELGLRDNEGKEVKLEVIEGKGEDVQESGNYCMDSTEFSGVVEDPKVGVQDDESFHSESQVLGEEMSENEGIASGGEIVDGAVRKNSGKLERRGIVWWKMPMEFLKYCVIKMSPVWTVSVAAAFMGLLILGRRLYKMKRKARGLQIKVAVDDKKASQVMSRAARLNEAFSVVKLVPVIRPSLPAVGSTSNWPVMSLR